MLLNIFFYFVTDGVTNQIKSIFCLWKHFSGQSLQVRQERKSGSFLGRKNFPDTKSLAHFCPIIGEDEKTVF
jgi:hypothetical protein